MRVSRRVRTRQVTCKVLRRIESDYHFLSSGYCLKVSEFKRYFAKYLRNIQRNHKTLKLKKDQRLECLKCGDQTSDLQNEPDVKIMDFDSSSSDGE